MKQNKNFVKVLGSTLTGKERFLWMLAGAPKYVYAPKSKGK